MAQNLDGLFGDTSSETLFEIVSHQRSQAQIQGTAKTQSPALQRPQNASLTPSRRKSQN